MGEGFFFRLGKFHSNYRGREVHASTYEFDEKDHNSNWT
jgi:hypothetical protein